MGTASIHFPSAFITCKAPTLSCHRIVKHLMTEHANVELNVQEAQINNGAYFIAVQTNAVSTETMERVSEERQYVLRVRTYSEDFVERSSRLGGIMQ